MSILSLVNMFLPEILEVRGFSAGVNVGSDRLRFLAPVPVGSRIRGKGEIVKVEEAKGGAVQSTVRITVEIEGPDGQPADKPACIVDTISRYLPE
jgi:acyl dehydratase